MDAVRASRYVFGQIPVGRSATNLAAQCPHTLVVACALRCTDILFSTRLFRIRHAFLFLILTAVLSGCSATALAQTRHKNVLILYDENKDFPGLILLDQTLTSTLRAGTSGRLDIYSEYMDLSRFPEENNRKRLRDYYQQKYEGRKIDAIVAVMGPAFNFMLQYGDELFPGTPIVFCGIDKREIENRNLGPNVTGVLVKRAFKPTLELALRLQPDVRQVVFIKGTSDFSKYWGEQARLELREFEGRVAISDLSNLSMEDIMKEVARLPPHTIILYLHVFRDGAGKAFQPNEALSLIAAEANAPIYVFLDQFVGKGPVGGHVYSMEAQGAKAGELGLRVLGGESPASIAVRDEGTNVDMFDWRQLQRWGIDESRLPAGSIVRYKEFSAWELYKWRIIGAIALIVVQALGIVWLLFTQATRRQAEKKSARFALLVKSEHQHLDEIVANVPGIVWESRFEDGDPTPKTTFVSPYLGKMLGYTSAEWMSQPGFWRSIVVDEDREQVETTIAHVLETGEEGILQARLRTKDEREVWVESHLTAICDEDGKRVGLRGVTMDISDRRQAEAALQENRAQLAGIIGSAMDAIISIDEHQRVVLFNAAAETMFGCSATEAIGHSLNVFIPSPFRDAQQDYLSALRQKDGTGVSIGSFGSLTGRRTSGEDFPLDVSISEVELNGARFFTIILRDITERLRADAILHERQQALGEAQRLAKVGSWEWDPATDTVTWSDELYRIMGRDPALRAPSYAQHPSYYTPASWALLKAAVERSLGDGSPYELELEMIHADGSLRWTNARGEVLRDADGNIIKLRGTLQDIAERKHAEAALQKAMEEVSELKNKLEEENIYLREEIKLAHNFDEIIGRTDAIKYVLFKIEQVAPTDSTVLINGETGTGKELVARAIHSSGLRQDRPLVRINCAALSPTLIESELFGHEKGAFTGATGRKLGRFELANDATIFLDEIGELPLELQGKLLRVIQEGEFERLGSSKTIKANVRIIAATNRNLKMAVEQGSFREDLWYRLNVFPITVPPLRDRMEDIPGLVEHFVKKFSQKLGRRISSISPASMRVLQDYTWPGNVRELANVLERAVINTNGSVLRVVDQFDKPRAEEVSRSNKTLEEMEKEYILRILDSTGWRIEGRRGAALILGLNPSTLRTRMAKLGIQKLNHDPTIAAAVS
ncbi:MAG TPA: sigma 54-interacting transcriptional regulator [Pyrinomonadaceae bacterium]|nr:sigma 54-interacting transcriptional regulator [Pyrinomonadaceae bacterium]